MNRTFDYIVVGAGSAGCALAARLSERSDFSVLLVEEGPDPARPDTISGAERDWLLRPELFQYMQTSRFDRQYWSEPEAELGGRRLFVPRGRVVGGTSTFIAGLAVRGNRADFDWPSDEVADWSYASVEPYFRELEYNRRPGIEPAFHGREGPLPVTDLPWVSPATSAFLKACQAQGYTANADFNGAEQTGFGRYQLYLDRQLMRVNSGNGYLTPEVRQRSNLAIVSDAQVQRIVLEPLGGKLIARGVEVSFLKDLRRETVQFTCRWEVILSCGAINTPQLLLLSGIGPRPLAARLNIRLFRELSGVGENLQDHLVVPMAYRFRDQARPHPFIASGIDGGMFLRTKGNSGPPNLQFVFNHALLGPPGEIIPEGYTLVPVLLHPASRGSVEPETAVPYARPKIRFNFLSATQDLAMLRFGVRRAVEILADSAFSDLRGTPLGPVPTPTSTDAAVDSFIRMAATPLFHPAGTCRMGQLGEPGAVVDPQLRVQGVRNLRIADASVIPRLPSGNIHTPTTMLAERLSSLLTGRKPSRTGRENAVSGPLLMNQEQIRV